MPVSYDDVLGYLADREGEPCAITGYVAETGDLVATDPDLRSALPDLSVIAAAMSLSVALGAFEPGTFEGHTGNRAALLDDDGIEIGTLTLTRDSFVNAALDARTGNLHVGMSASATSPPLALVDGHEHARALSSRDVGGWIWSFSFGATPGIEADA